MRSEKLTNSITGPLALVEGDAAEIDGALTLFNASLYLLKIRVRFLVAIESSNSDPKIKGTDLRKRKRTELWSWPSEKVKEIDRKRG